MKLMIIDGNSIVNRAFYGVKALANRDGMFTNAIYGFLATYLRLISEENPCKVVVCFDVRAKTFRHEMYADYKGTRKGMPDELAMQMPILKEILDALGIDRYEKEGFEADDLIGSIAKFCDENGHKSVIVTGDKDALQLATDNTTVNLIVTSRGQTSTKKYDFTAFCDEYGFKPEILCDLKGLMGDTSDNIKGVAGVGEKTAMNLIHNFLNLEGIYENIDDESIKKGVREKLLKDKESAFDSRKLATIIRDVDLDFDINRENLRNDDKLFEILNKLDMKTMISKLNVTANLSKVEKIELVLPKYTEISSVDELKVTGDCYVSGDTDRIAIVCEKSAYIVKNPSKSMLEYIFSQEISKVMHDAKSFLVKIIKKGIVPHGIIFDTALAMYLIDPSLSEYNLADMSEQFLGVQPNLERKQITLFESVENDDDLFVSCVVLQKLYPILKKDLGDMSQLFYDVELPLMTVLANMQTIGVKVDDVELRAYGEKLNIRINELVEEINKLSGEKFNINSPKQLGEILFEKLNLPVSKKTKTGYSTSVEVLEFLRDKHPIIEFILEYRTLAKLHSTYVEGLFKVIQDDGKIHTTFNQMVTITGRLSSTEPNLQNIPVRTPIGSELRKMFVVSDENYVLIDADYSQIELRILADMADDKVMLDAFASGVDIHTVTASQVFNTEISEVTSVMRSRAKAVNFGIVYGISEFSLGNDIGVSRAEAKEYMQNYLEKYSGVANYMEKIKQKAHEDGYVTTLFGRKRNLPELKSSNFNTRSFGERVALNAPIQGTAADIIKIAMVKVYQRMNAEKLKSRLILQIHDELIIEATLDEKDYVASLLKEEMENAFSGKVKLLADYNFGKSWYEAK
ncbi:MAG: DNA polymerase I [Clostridia bacterium]